MQTVRELVNSTGVDEKITKYTFLSEYLKRNLCLSSDEEKQLMVCINRDISVTNDGLILIILEICDFLIKTDKSTVDHLNVSCILETVKKAGANRQEIEKFTRSILETIITNCFIDNNLRKMPELFSYEDAQKAFEKASKRFSTPKLAATLSKLVPQLLEDDIQQEFRNFLCDCALVLINDEEVLETANLCTQEFRTNCKKKYFNFIDNLRKASCISWHKLWIILVRILGTLLHEKIELTNTMLNTLQSAFETKNSIDKICAYECWIELINNYNLNRNYLCASKQIKLLTKPIKAKLSKARDVQIKRFYVWEHLLMQLDDQSELCLEEYLIYSFLPLKDIKSLSTIELANVYCIPKEIWPKITELLISLMGHRCPITDKCLSDNLCNFKQPAVNNIVFEKYLGNIMTSVVLCCKLLAAWANEETLKKVINCIGTSFLDKLNEIADEDNRGSALEEFGNVLNLLLENSYETLDGLGVVVECVLDVLLQYKWNINFTKVYEVIFIPVIKVSLDYEVLPESSRKVIENILNFSVRVIHYKSYYMLTSDLLFYNQKPKTWLNLRLWNSLCVCCFRTLQYKEYPERTEDLLTWLLRYYELDCDSKKETLKNWDKLTNSYLLTYPEQVIKLVDSIINAERICAIYRPSLISLFSTLIPFVTKFDNVDQAAKILTILLEILKLPYIGALTEPLLSVVKFLMAFANKRSVFKISLFTCVQKFIFPHKVYKAVPILHDFLTKYPAWKSKITADFNKQLQEELQRGSQNKQLQELENILCPPSKGDTPKTSLTEQSEPSKKDNVFKYFGALGNNNAAETKSPFKLTAAEQRKSVIQSTVKPEDDDSAKYVLIDTEYKFEPSKLTKHQRESFRKPKDDIPALYQDLSQSTLNAYENSNSSPVEPLNFVAVNLKQEIVESDATSDEVATNNGNDTDSEATDEQKQNKKRLKGLALEIKRIRIDINNADAFSKPKNAKRTPKLVISTLRRSLVRPKTDADAQSDTSDASSDASRKSLLDNNGQNKHKTKKAGNFSGNKDSPSSSPSSSPSPNPNPSPSPVLVASPVKTSNVSKSLRKRPKRIYTRKRKPGTIKIANLLSLSNNVEAEVCTHNSHVGTQVPGTQNSVDVVESSQEPPIIVVSNKLKTSVNLSNDTGKIQDSFVAQNVQEENKLSDSDLFDSSAKSNVSLSEMLTLTATKAGKKDEPKLDESSVCDMSTLTLSAKEVSLSDLPTQSPEKAVEEVPKSSPEILGDKKIRSPCYVILKQTPERELQKRLSPCVVNLATKPEFASSPERSLLTNLPSSPVSNDTPRRISKLLDETTNISPIKEDVLLGDVQTQPNNDTKKPTSTKNKPTSKTNTTATTKTNTTTAETNTATTKTNTSTTATSNGTGISKGKRRLNLTYNLSSRSQMLLNLKPSKQIKANVVQVEKVEKIKDNNNVAAAVSSPRTERIRKMMTQNANTYLKLMKKPANGVEEQPQVASAKEAPPVDVVPMSGILKRKAPDTPFETASPAFKKKRVNFCDPLITSEKIIANDFDSSNEIDEKLQKMFDDIPEQAAEVEEEVEEENVVLHENPIYANLVDCQDSVRNVLKYLTSKQPKVLLKKLQERNINTVGDLAKLNNVEIIRLPLFCSKLFSVINSLKLYDNELRHKQKTENANFMDGITPLENDIEKNEDCTVENIFQNVKSLNLTKAQLRKLNDRIQTLL